MVSVRDDDNNNDNNNNNNNNNNKYKQCLCWAVLHRETKIKEIDRPLYLKLTLDRGFPQ